MSQALEWLDTHMHLDRLDLTPEESVKEALAAGVQRMITIGTGPEDHPLVLEFAKKFSPYVYCTLGVHPHDGQVYNQAIADFFEKHLSDPEVVAVGEIGLDYHYNHSTKDDQLSAFRAQMTLAQKFGLPVEIHSRDAEDDTVMVLKEFPKVKGIIHCFSGSQKFASECLALGYSLSISGIVTFKTAEEICRVVESTPLDRLFVETDAPFLTPVPFRGKKNRPAMVVHTAKKVAELKGVSMDELSKSCKANAQRMFPRMKWP